MIRYTSTRTVFFLFLNASAGNISIVVAGEGGRGRLDGILKE